MVRSAYMLNPSVVHRGFSRYSMFLVTLNASLHYH
jgi:hypothetical protein